MILAEAGMVILKAPFEFVMLWLITLRVKGRRVQAAQL
jgi:hypothetical protein